MVRFRILLAVLAMFAAGCASAADSVETATASVDDAAPEQTIEPEGADDVAEVLPTGREAMAANTGKAHVLWFWGAH